MVGVVSLTAALVTTAPGVSQHIAGAFACMIDRVGGSAGSCGSGDAGVPGPVSERTPPTGPDDGLTDQQRAARDLEPGLYDDVPGTADERINTTTPPPPDGDQCSYSFDKVPGLYDFSYACYAHDLCWQNGTIGGTPMTIGACNDEFRRRMRDHCDRRNTGFGSGFRENICFDAADAYFAGVSAAGVAKTVADCPALVAELGPEAAMYACHPT